MEPDIPPDDVELHRLPTGPASDSAPIDLMTGPIPAEPSFPEGGLQAWLTVTGAYVLLQILRFHDGA